MKNLWLKIFFVGILLLSCSAMIFREYVEMLYDDLVRSFMNRPKTSVSATLPTFDFNNLPTLMDYDNLPSAAALQPSERANTWSLAGSTLSGKLHASSDVTTHSYGNGYGAVQPLPARQAVGYSVLSVMPTPTPVLFLTSNHTIPFAASHVEGGVTTHVTKRTMIADSGLNPGYDPEDPFKTPLDDDLLLLFLLLLFFLRMAPGKHTQL